MRLTINHFAILFISLGGLMGSMFGVSFFAFIFSFLGLLCFLFSMQKKEFFLWLLLAFSLLLLFQKGTLLAFEKAFVLSCVFGTLMIAISFVALAANNSHIKFLLQRFFSKKRSNVFSYVLGHISGALLNLSGLLILVSSLENKDQKSLSKNVILIHRGFSFAPAWSPYSYFTPIILLTFSNIKWFDLVLVAFTFIIPIFVLSCFILKTKEQTNISNDLIQKNAIKEKKALIYAVLFCLSIISIMSFSNISSKVIIHWILPSLALIWLVLESRKLADFFNNTKKHFILTIPSLRFEILALCTAGFLTSVFADINLNQYLNYSEFETLFKNSIFNTSLLIILMFTSIVSVMFLGINPILFVGIVSWGANMELYSSITAVSILVGSWGMFSTLSPFAAANLVVARASSLSGNILSFKINKNYNIITYFICVIIILCFHILS
ncbi:MAG: hypothetical protein COA66_00770 [Arcobacter sp.]|nr:MAG: hypothetical protein COA66_00770 [Arcobacter sp.]